MAQTLCSKIQLKQSDTSFSINHLKPEQQLVNRGWSKNQLLNHAMININTGINTGEDKPKQPTCEMQFPFNLYT